MLRKTRVCLVLLSQLGLAQLPTGSIQGLVTDSSGSAVTTVVVTITELSTGRAISVVTNEAGRYSVNNLLPGAYTVRLEGPGYQTFEIRDIPLNSAETYNGDVTLSPGAPDIVVTVLGRASSVETATHTVRTVFTDDEIANFPMFGRNFMDLARLAPGVVVMGGSVLDPTKAGIAYRAVGIAGRAGAGTRIQIDGIDITDPIGGGTLVNLSAEAVKEFQLSQSSLDSSAPMTSTGVIQIIGKSGGNDVHGSGFWNFFNQDMGARPNYEPDVLPLSRHQAGGSASGPFIREKLFWFANAERTWQHTSFTPVVREFPQLRVTQRFPSDILYAKGRMDWNVKPAVRLFGSFLHDWNVTTGGGATSPYQNVNWGNAVIGGMEISRPATTYSYRFGFTNYNNRIESRELSIPFPRAPSGLPFYLGVGPYQVGPNGLAPQATGISSLQNQFTASVLRGRHMLRAGATVDRSVAAGFLADQRLNVIGIYNAATIAEVQSRGGNPENPMEYPLSRFSVGTGLGYIFLKSGHGFPFGAHKDTRTALFAVHTYRLKKLALTSGLRWNYSTGYFPNDDRVPRHPAFDRWVTGASTPLQAPRDLLSPQFGFAYDPFGAGRTAIRGGFSRSVERLLVGNLVADQSGLLPLELASGFFTESFVAGPDGRPINVDGHPQGNYSDFLGLPIKEVIGTLGRVHEAVQTAYASYVPAPAVGNTAFDTTRGFAGAFIPGSQYKVPYSLQFNIGVQHELFRRTVLTVDYVRNRGVGLPIVVRDLEMYRDARTFDENSARAQVNRVLRGQTVNDWINANPRGTIANFGLINDQIWTGVTPDYFGASFIAGGFSLYRALQVSVRGRHGGVPLFREPVYVVNYALSRTEATASEDNPEQLTGAHRRDWNSRSRFGPTPLDVTHALNGLVTFTAPGGLRLTAQTGFRTAAPSSISLPALGAASGVNSVFGTDLDGDYIGDYLPGVGEGQFGRGVKTLSDLNRHIANYNANVAGHLTPHGQAFVRAGLFTENEMRRLGASAPTITSIPERNPWPWHNAFVTNLRVFRPIRFEKLGTVWQVGPFADVFNLFNHAPTAPYGGLSGLFGSLNFDYANAPPGQQLADLNYRRGRISGTRQFQVGVRLDF